MVSHRRLLLGAGLLSLALAHPLHAQRVQDWQYKWYWGIEGGMVGYTLPTTGQQFVPSGGLEWLITQRRVALYLGYLQSFTAEADTFAVQGLTGTNNFVEFDGYRQFQANFLAMIGDKSIQPYVGGGFVLAMLSNARQPGASSTVATAINTAASGGFLQVMGGVHLRFGKKAAGFVQYQYTPHGRTFLLPGGGHTMSLGLRYALLSSKESDPSSGRR